MTAIIALAWKSNQLLTLGNISDNNYPGRENTYILDL
jgi:hypothetical protein